VSSWVEIIVNRINDGVVTLGNRAAEELDHETTDGLECALAFNLGFVVEEFMGLSCSLDSGGKAKRAAAVLTKGACDVLCREFFGSVKRLSAREREAWDTLERAMALFEGEKDEVA